MRLRFGTLVSFAVLSACSSDPPSSPAGQGGTAGHAAAGSGGSGPATGGSAGHAASGGTAGTGVSGSAGRGASGAAGPVTMPVAGAAGTSPMGTGGSASGASGTGGALQAGTGGVANGTGGLGGQPAGGAGASAGASGTSGSGGWKCPSDVTGVPTLTGTPTRVAGVPPVDSFNNNNDDWGNIEGPVWIGDALYVSEMTNASYSTSDSNEKKSRILKVTGSGQTSIFVADSGSNGLAVDADGNIVAGVHKDGSIDRFALPSGTQSAIATMYMGKRFNSPNDLVIHSNGTIYFTDPTFNGPTTPPQSAMRAYRIAPGGQPEPIPSAASPDTFNNPNGITLSLAEDFLYVVASTGRRYPVMPDGTVGAGTDFPAVSNGDGITVDCAGNLYVANANAATITAYKPDGTKIGTITVPDVQSATNVAFGGADHKTLYLTGLGNNKGLFQMTLNLPGRPY